MHCKNSAAFIIREMVIRAVMVAGRSAAAL